MAILTRDILLEKGFEDNHPERPIHKLYLHGGNVNNEFNVIVEEEYKSNTNKLGFKVSCWREENGCIVKRSSANTLFTTEEADMVMALSDINVSLT